MTSSPLLAHTTGPECVMAAVDAFAGSATGLDPVEQVDTDPTSVLFSLEIIFCTADGFAPRSAFGWAAADVVAGFGADDDPGNFFGVHWYCGVVSTLFAPRDNDCNTMAISANASTAMTGYAKGPAASK